MDCLSDSLNETTQTLWPQRDYVEERLQDRVSERGYQGVLCEVEGGDQHNTRLVLLKVVVGTGGSHRANTNEASREFVSVYSMKQAYKYIYSSRDTRTVAYRDRSHPELQDLPTRRATPRRQVGSRGRAATNGQQNAVVQCKD